MIRLQQRDREIIKVCYEQQFILTEHVSDHFFGGNYLQALRRVIELRSADYLRPAGFKIGQKMAHVLGHQGMPVAESVSPLRLTQYPAIDPKTIEHDAIVTDIRLRLSSIWDGEWIPEKGIRSDDPTQIPDGIFLFENGKQAAIEVENSLKGRTRFERRLKQWPASGVSVVLYIATTNEIFGALKTYLGSAVDEPVCCLIGLDSIRSGHSHVWSKIGEIDLFTERMLP